MAVFALQWKNRANSDEVLLLEFFAPYRGESAKKRRSQGLVFRGVPRKMRFSAPLTAAQTCGRFGCCLPDFEKIPCAACRTPASWPGWPSAVKSLDKFSEKRYTPQALRPAGCQWLCQRYIINIIRSVSVSVNTQIIVSSPLRYVSGEPKAKPKNIRSAKFHAKTGVIWRLLRKKRPEKRDFSNFYRKIL